MTSQNSICSTSRLTTRAGVLLAQAFAAVAEESWLSVIAQQVDAHRPPSPWCRAAPRPTGCRRPRRGSKGLGDRQRLGDAGGFDQQIVEAPLLGQPGDLDQQVLAQRAADAAVASSRPAFPRCATAPRRRRATRSASMFTSDMSLTITATRRPSRLFRTWLSSVVLPAPRKPDRTVTGRRGSFLLCCLIMFCPDECRGIGAEITSMCCP